MGVTNKVRTPSERSIVEKTWGQQDVFAIAPQSRVIGERPLAEMVSRDVTVTAPRPIDPNDLQFSELEIRYDAEDKIFWQFMSPHGRPSYTMGLLRDMRQSLLCIERLFADRRRNEDRPIDYVVMASRLPKMFNLGGDLPLFVELIRAGNKEALRNYAHACIDVQYPRANNQGLPYISVSLVQGDALGGGFEAALADDMIIAERSAKFGLPEILFNLYPGMGAYSFLSRRLDPIQAERMILSGKIYSAEELYEIGLVDVVAEDGEGEAAVYDLVARNRRSYEARRAIFEARRIARPITRSELISITDLWVDAAMTLEFGDLRKMERLASAQDRRRQG